MIREIKARMVRKGVQNKDIARKAGVSPTWVSLVLNGHRRSPRIRKAIADALGATVGELWPEEEEKAA